MNQTIPLLQFESRRSQQYSNQKQNKKANPSKTSRSKFNTTTLIEKQQLLQKQLLRDKRKKYSDAIRQRNLKKLNQIQLTQITNFTNNQSISQLPLSKKKSINKIHSNNSFCSLSMIQSQNNLSIKQKKQQAKSIRNKNKYNSNYIKNLKSINEVKENITYIKIHQQQNNFSSYRKNDKVQNQKIDQTTLSQKQSCMILSPITKAQQKIQLLEKQISQSKQHIKSLQQIIQDLFKKQCLKQKSHSKQQDFSINSFVVERLMNLQQQVFNLKKIKNSLQLKIHSSQIKFAHEADIIRKQSAKQIWNWKLRYNKILGQNIKLKAKMSDTLQISISKDQDIDS